MPTKTESPETERTPNITSSSVAEPDPQIELAIFQPGETTPTRAFTLTKTGIVIHEDMTSEQWREGLKLFKFAKTSISIAFADYLSFGRARYGLKYVNDELEQLEFALTDITKAVDIGTIPTDLRHDNLTAEHYVVLARAGVTKPLRAKWSKIASEQNLSPGQLKSSIAAGEVVSTSIARQQQHGLVNIHGIRGEFDIWMRRVGGAKGIQKMDADHRREIVGEIKPIADLYNILINDTPAKPAKEKKA